MIPLIVIAVKCTFKLINRLHYTHMLIFSHLSETIISPNVIAIVFINVGRNCRCRAFYCERIITKIFNAISFERIFITSYIILLLINRLNERRNRLSDYIFIYEYIDI